MIPRFFPALLAALALLAPWPVQAQSEAMLQYFNTSWKEIERRIPELAEAGYTSLWLPPPQKSSAGSYSVGYDPLDRFDLGDKDQAGTVPTRYGTKADLLRMVETAHRFGLRVYFDNVMAHTGGNLDNVNPGTLFPSIPGFVPEDFHLVRNPGGGWKKASNDVNYNDEWQVLNRNPFAWDIAQENPNTSFDPTGQQEDKDYPKWLGIRHAGQTSLYPDNDLAGVTDGEGFAVHPFADKEPFQDVGYGANATGANNGKFDWQDTNGNGQHDAGEPSEPFTDTGVDPSNPAHQTAAWGYGDGRYNMGNPVAEDVNGMLIRSIRWTLDQTHCDGFRLDAVKHVPSYFFGAQSGNKDPSSAGFLGGAQAQFNLTHGFSDWSSHRDSTYSTNAVRNDLMLFGEHLGAPPNPNDYLAAGMRIANDDFLNSVGSGIGGSLAGYDDPGHFTFGVNSGVMYCLSHDNNYMAGSERPAAHQYMLTRAGVPIVYTDGFNITDFPKPSYVPFLGQYGQTYVTGPLAIRRDFIRGDQWPRWSSQNVAGWEFRDYSENTGMSAADATTLLVMHARNYTGGQQMPFSTVFPAGARLKNYSPFNGPFFANVGNDGLLRGDDGNILIIPSSGYFAFSYDVPELPNLWQGTANHAIDILENGVPSGAISVVRKDGANGDPAYTQTVQIPVVRNGSNLRFVARTDGGAENVLMKLDGGLDLNSQANLGPTTGEKRDYPPGTATDTFLGYEQMQFVRRTVEKFAAQNVARNVIGSPGAETWKAVIGTGFDAASPVQGGGVNTGTSTANYVFHNPAINRDGASSAPQFTPQPAVAGGQAITVRVKTAYQFQVNQTWLYYTIDGSAPEGLAGTPLGTTHAVAMTFESAGADDGTLHTDWWVSTIPAQASGTILRYKIGALQTSAASVFPSSAANVEIKKRAETVFQIPNFNATTCTVFPHNDLDERSVGLKEGFHVLRTKAFLSRSGRASLFKTSTQTFYYDTQRPTGQMLYPAENATIGGSTYGCVVLTDASVTGVQFNILDNNTANDSTANGNGAGAWASATEVTPVQLGNTGYAREWRFTYKSIPGSGAAILNVRLREPSSASDNTLSDAAGWYTTVTRQILTGAALNYRIQYPTTDGEVINPTYVGKVLFDKSLSYNSGTAIPAAQMVSEFTITLDGVLVPRANYTFNLNETGSESALAFTVPNFYSGDPTDLHELQATQARGDISLTDVRLVKAQPGVILDTDGDGISDWWARKYFGHPTGQAGDLSRAQDDRDNDGASNLLEFMGGLDPLNRGQGITSITPQITRSGSTTKLQFAVIANRQYQVEGSQDLATWFNIGAGYTPASANAAYKWTEPQATNGARYYRVRISLP